MTITRFLSRQRTSMAVACLLLNGLASAAPAPDTAASAAEASAHIDALIGKAPCQTQSQCHAIAIGAKPCGGPRSWRAWSDMKTDPAALEAAVDAQAAAERKANKTEGLASDCMMTPQPQAVCRPGANGGPKSCELGQGGAESAM